MTAPTRKTRVNARVARGRTGRKGRATRNKPVTMGGLALHALETATEKSAAFFSATARRLGRVQNVLRRAR